MEASSGKRSLRGTGLLQNCNLPPFIKLEPWPRWSGLLRGVRIRRGKSRQQLVDGEFYFIHPDWDMFQPDHPCADFYAVSWAISGGTLYVSDSVGNHNFNLLTKLVLPDRSVLRCQHYALPIRDCFFQDPPHDGKTILKIRNLNKLRHLPTFKFT